MLERTGNPRVGETIIRKEFFMMPGFKCHTFAGVLLFVCIAMLSVGPASAAVSSETVPTATPEFDDAAKYSRAAVTLDGDVLFHVRGISAYPAEERANKINARIRTFASDRSLPVDSLRTFESSTGTDIAAGDQFLMTVTDVDAAAEHASRQLLAGVLRRAIADAVISYRAARNTRALATHTGYALGATLVAVILLFVTRRVFRGLGALLERHFKPRIEGLGAKSGHIVHTEPLWAMFRTLMTAARVFSMLLIVYLYLEIVLALYPWTHSFSKQVAGIILDPLRDMGVGVLKAVPGLIFIGVLVVVVRYILKVTRLFFAGIEQGKFAFAGFDPDWAWPTHKIVRVLIIAFAVIVSWSHIPGSGSGAFKGVSIFLGVIVSLGSSSVVTNIIAGYTMIYRRAFKVGDRVQIGDVMGDVVDAGVLVTHLRTIKNEEIVVPNSLIMNANITNYNTLAKTRGLILHTTVGIGYEAPWRQVEAMLKLAAERTPGFLKDPPPFVLQKFLGDFAVTYELNVYTDNPQNMLQVYTALHRNILDVFNEYGVQIMTPAYEGDPEQPKVVSKTQWFAAPAAGSSSPNGKPEGPPPSR